MIPHHWLIGGVSATIGIALVTASVGNAESLFQLAKIRFLESLLGRHRTRVACTLGGLSLIVVGVLILCGYLPRRSVSPRLGFHFGASSPETVL